MHSGTTNLKMRATSNLRAKRAEIKQLEHCRIVAFCFMRISVFYAICHRIIPPSVFNFYTFPLIFSRKHLPSPVNGVDAPVYDISLNV